jgi:type IV pilus assembly protein PilM
VAVLQKTPEARSRVLIKNKLFGKINFHEKFLANTYLGIDIGITDVRYVYLYRLKNKFEIISYGLEKFPSMDLDRSKAIRLALRNLFTKRKIKATQVVLSVYGPEISTRIIELPDMPEKELRSAIFIRNKNEIAFFNEDTVWDYRILQKNTSGDRVTLKILVMVAHNEALVDYLEALAEIGIKPSLIIPKPLAHEGAYCQMVSPHGRDLLIDVGDQSTMFCFFNDGQLWYVRNIATGGENIKKGLEKEIEKNTILVKRKLENMGKPPVINDRLKAKIKELSMKNNGALEIFLGEVNRTVQYIKNEFRLDGIDNVFVCGRGSIEEGVVDRVGDMLRTDAEYLFPIFKPVYKIQDYIDFVSPFGAALYISDNFNLIPGGYKESWRFNYYLRWAYLSGIAVFLTIGVLTYQSFVDYKITKESFRKEMDTFRKLNPKFKQYENAREKLEETWKEYKSFVEVTGKDDFPLAVLAAVSQSIPDGLIVTEFLYDRGSDIPFSFDLPRKVTIRGETYKNEHLWDSLLPAFVESLKNVKIFNKVLLINQEFSQEENKGKFEIDVVINEGKKNEKKKAK